MKAQPRLPVSSDEVIWCYNEDSRIIIKGKAGREKWWKKTFILLLFLENISQNLVRCREKCAGYLRSLNV
jgi:hypothetical protein